MAASVSGNVEAVKSVSGNGGLFVVKVQVKIVTLIRLMTLVPSVQNLNT
jgi:hypothetical protein